MRGFAGAGLATDNHHLVRSDGRLDLRTPIGFWQGIAEARLWETRVAKLGFVLGETNLLVEFLNYGQVAFVQKYSVEITSVMQYPDDDDTVRR